MQGLQGLHCLGWCARIECHLTLDKCLFELFESVRFESLKNALPINRTVERFQLGTFDRELLIIADEPPKIHKIGLLVVSKCSTDVADICLED